MHGGPADGKVLMVASAPGLLRLTYVRGRKQGKRAFEWDALDRPVDQPEPGETIYVYRRVTRAVQIHLQLSPRSASGFFAMAHYEFVDTDGERFRDQSEWSKYVRSEPWEEPTADPSTYRAAS
jgi:hypothetical protein